MGFECAKRPPLPCRGSGKDETPTLTVGSLGFRVRAPLPGKVQECPEPGGRPSRSLALRGALGSPLPPFPRDPGAESRSERFLARGEADAGQRAPATAPGAATFTPGGCFPLISRAIPSLRG